MHGTALAILSILSITFAQLEPPSLRFTPRHAHAATGPKILLSDDIAPGLQNQESVIRTRPISIYRPRSNKAFQEARLRSLREQETEEVEWDQVTVLAPDVEDRRTLLELAKMTGDAYALPGQPNWYEVDGQWNTSIPFGWEDDGFRGNVFVSSDNSSVVLSIKGTSLLSQGNTAKKDKLNDNLLFSCCCARVDIKWAFSTVCNCFSGGWKCDQTCLERSLAEDNLFYNVGIRLYNNITFMYPNANIWLVGHSLGGAVASLIGATFGVPVVTYEAPGEKLAATRLHLPSPPSSIPVPAYHMLGSQWALSPSVLPRVDPYYHPTTHVWHTADPIPQGICNGVRSLCAKAGYAMESRCHLGKTIVYDTVTKLGWRVDLQTHRISQIIYKVLNEDWFDDDDEDPTGGTYRPVPEAKPEVDCVDCFKWDFGDFKID